MPALLKNWECLACGHRHHFCIAVGDLTPGVKYTYTCPATGKGASLRPGERGELVTYFPQGAVALTAAAVAQRKAA